MLTCAVCMQAFGHMPVICVRQHLGGKVTLTPTNDVCTKASNHMCVTNVNPVLRGKVTLTSTFAQCMNAFGHLNVTFANRLLAQKANLALTSTQYILPKLKKRVKKREERTHNALSDHGFTYERELQNKFNSRAERPFSARVDFAVLRSWGYVYVEVDERQHKPYPEGHDAERMQLILAEHMIEGRAGKVHIIRFNLDAFSLNGVRQKLPLKERVDTLVAVLGFELVKQYAITYLYYDRSDCPLPDVCLSAAYPASLREIVLDASYLHTSLARDNGV